MFKIIQKYLYPIIFIILFIVIWDTAVRLYNIEPWILPDPISVFKTFFSNLQFLIEHSKSTMAAAFIGLFLAVIVAVLLSIIMDYSYFLKKGLYPLIIISQTIPIIAVAPLFIIWFGFGLLPKVVVVALVCFFPAAVSLIQGMESADPEVISLLSVMGAKPWKIIKLVKIPAALPSFFSGLKIAGTYAVMGAVIGEWLGAKKGLGVFMTRATHAYQLDKVLSAIVIISLISLVIFVIIDITARIIMPWYYKERGNI
jgi:ABC-type nitrate/sulfonate/bicarbonate transport system permease component